MHIFAKEQPDLNWENENLREEIYEMIQFWINHKVDGFRIIRTIYLPPDCLNQQKLANLPTHYRDASTISGVTIDSNSPDFGFVY